MLFASWRSYAIAMQCLSRLPLNCSRPQPGAPRPACSLLALPFGGCARLLERVLDVARWGDLLKARSRQRMDSTHVLAAVRDLNRIKLLGETLRATLNRALCAALNYFWSLPNKTDGCHDAPVALNDRPNEKLKVK